MHRLTNQGHSPCQSGIDNALDGLPYFNCNNPSTAVPSSIPSPSHIGIVVSESIFEKAILVEKDTHLLELSRYVVLNPVQAGMTDTAGDWPWSSYRAVMGKSAAPDWLAIDETLELFHIKRGPARRAFARFVADGINADDPFDQMPRPGFLGSESFLETILDKFDKQSISTEVPKKLHPARSLEQIARASADRDQAITEADRTGAYTLTEIARHFGVHQPTASRIARRASHA